MKDHIAVDLTAVSLAIDRLRSRPLQEALTADIIREYMGGFYANVGVDVVLSWNAQFGRILARHADTLCITELKSDQKIEDDRGHATSSSLWAI